MTPKRHTHTNDGSEMMTPAAMYLTDVQLAARWAISPKTLRNARVTGGFIPWVRIGRLVRYKIEDVAAWELAHRQTTTFQNDENT